MCLIFWAYAQHVLNDFMRKRFKHKNTNIMPKYNFLSNHLPPLKVPKREIFVTELIILSDPLWIGDLRTKAKNRFVWIVRLLFAILYFYRWLSMR
jgi:hypothetical protein